MANPPKSLNPNCLPDERPSAVTTQYSIEIEKTEIKNHPGARTPECHCETWGARRSNLAQADPSAEFMLPVLRASEGSEVPPVPSLSRGIYGGTEPKDLAAGWTPGTRHRKLGARS